MAYDKDIMWCDTGWFRGCGFYFGFAPNEKAWDRGTKKLNIVEDYPNDTAARTSTYELDNGCIYSIVTLKDELEKSYSPLEISCLIFHESVHVWQSLLEHIGEEAPSPEFEAYSLQAIAQEIIHRFELSRRPLKDCDKSE